MAPCQYIVYQINYLKMPDLFKTSDIQTRSLVLWSIIKNPSHISRYTYYINRNDFSEWQSLDKFVKLFNWFSSGKRQRENAYITFFAEFLKNTNCNYSSQEKILDLSFCESSSKLVCVTVAIVDITTHTEIQPVIMPEGKVK